MMPSIAETIFEYGISTITVSAGIFFLYFLGKHIVIKMSKSVDDLVEHIQQFSIYVRQEHKEQSENQKAMQDQQQSLQQQHNEMMINLKEITVTLGRINGYKDRQERDAPQDQRDRR